MSFSNLEQIAQARAATQYLSGLDSLEEAWAAYDQLVKSVEDGSEPDLVRWQPFENWDWAELLDQIQSESEANNLLFKKILSQVKCGLVASAIDCTLDSDMNMVDMEILFSVGGSDHVHI